MPADKPWIPKKKLTQPQSIPLVHPDFRPEFLDFKRGGIRMGNIEPNQRITQIIKAALEDRYQTPMVIDKWGRGTYWKWICWLSRQSRAAKPTSGKLSFACAKFYIALDGDDQTFEAGIQIERALLASAPADEDPAHGGVRTQDDWDFYNLLRGMRKGSPIYEFIARLVGQDGFTVRTGPFSQMIESRGSKPPPAARLKRSLQSIPPDEWGGFQVCYVFRRQELIGMSGDDIIQTILSIFHELAPLMNRLMTTPSLKLDSPD